MKHPKSKTEKGNILYDIVRTLKKYATARPASQKGYLLIELLVALTLFSVIVLIAVGSFVNALKTQRQIAAIAAAENNLDTVLEQMAREIRTGNSFSSGTGTFSFINAEGDTVKYFLAPDNAPDNANVLEKTVVPSGETIGTTLPITGTNINVSYFNAILFGRVSSALFSSGGDSGDHWNPRITITLGIQPKEASLSGTVLNLQTTVSARHIECDTSVNPPKC